ncbi:MAG: thiamine-phosphate kinase [Burkholderiales bacterium]|nr:thiamine-phosphate kinase [Nitrosomonadaceae bacterium]
MTPEFALIERFFTRDASSPFVRLGVGDDCALLDPTPGKSLAISTDTLVTGVHFFADAEPESLGHKALAVNLSDLAAMGATACACTLALTLPSVDEAWLAAFSRGFFALADQHGCALIGGDTTRGPLSITITVFGELDAAHALRRDRAQANDDVWLSGSVGGAALGLAHLQGKLTLAPNVLPRALARLHRPTPQLALGARLLGVARAAIDVSDGLVADLGHIGRRSVHGSALTAVIDWPRVPLHPSLLSVAPDMRQQCALTGGDDYELCFTAAAEQRAAIESIAAELGVSLTRIGSMQAAVGNEPHVVVRDAQGAAMALASSGYDHFTPSASPAA